MAALPRERLAIVPDSLRAHVVANLHAYWYRRLWCAACGCANHGSAWVSEKDWCPSCDWNGVPVDYAAVRRIEPAAPGRTRRAQYVPVAHWRPLFPDNTPRNA